METENILTWVPILELGEKMPYSLSELGSLTNEKIDQMVKKKSPGVDVPGVYVLDKSSTAPFHVDYVGRSDDDLNARLKTHVGSVYKYFKFDYATSPKNAFEKECELYHDFGGPQGKLDNKVHPDRPAGSGWKCPKCTIFG